MPIFIAALGMAVLAAAAHEWEAAIAMAVTTLLCIFLAAIAVRTKK